MKKTYCDFCNCEIDNSNHYTVHPQSLLAKHCNECCFHCAEDFAKMIDEAIINFKKEKAR